MTEMPAQPARRKLWLTSVDQAVSELNRLRSAGYTRRGNWSLPQVCFHVRKTIQNNLTPAATTEPTAEELAIREKFFAMALNPDGFPPGLPIPAELTPPVDLPEDEVDHFIAALTDLKSGPVTHLKIGRCGPVPVEQVIALHLSHASHHLSFLEPSPVPTPPKKRRNLRYSGEADVIADVQNLRRGYLQHGTWTLAQNCWHLTLGVKARMAPCPNPVPPNTPEQDARKHILEKVLATGELPPNLPAPDSMLPPADAGEAAIEDFIAILNEFKNFPGPIAPHRLFGFLPDDVARRVNLMHCANHLSNLEPTTPVPSPGSPSE